MPKYTLIYFNARGRAESARLILTVAGVEYDDHRIEKDDWPALKPSMPYGLLPVLEVDGRKIAQSMAICKYLADQHKLMGRNPMERAAIEACCDTITEIREKLFEVLMSKEPEKEKKKKIDGFKEVTLPEMLGKLEECLKRNKGGDKYFFGDKMSLADIHFFGCCEPVMMLDSESLKGFPKLADLYDRVKNDAKIHKWLENRPVTEN